MDYKGFRIYACKDRCERYLIQDGGGLGQSIGDCTFHDDSTVLYEIVNGHGTTVGIMDSLDDAKAHVEELITGARVIA
jgi:hypothetical protein